jgi:prepilin-type N-terminal cleavage/methylation domain-containing protein
VGKRSHAIRRSDSGFTLTELLIVIVILGVLTGIVVFAVGAFTDRGEIAACKADMKTVESASEAYRAQNGSYAATIAALVAGGYLKSAPSTTNYTITYTVVAGPPQTATVTGAIVGGGAC